MAKKMKQFHALRKFGRESRLVYLRLSWLDSVSTRFEKQIKSVKQCFPPVEPRIVYSTNELLSATNKDVLPALKKSKLIYQFSCHCDSRCIGRISQRLPDKIKQHAPKCIPTCSSQERILPARRCKFSSQPSTSLLLLIQPLGFICYKILPVLNTMMTVDSLFFPKAALLSIYLLLKPLSSKLLILPSADKKNSCTA